MAVTNGEGPAWHLCVPSDRGENGEEVQIHVFAGGVSLSKLIMVATEFSLLQSGQYPVGLRVYACVYVCMCVPFLCSCGSL